MSPERRLEIEALVALARGRMSPERAFALLSACGELLALTAPSCRVCDAAARHARAPAVAVAVARLKDELAVAEMLATSTPDAKPALGRLSDWRRTRVARIAHWRIVLESLAHGPLPTVLIDEDLHGPPVADPPAMTRRRERTRSVVRRLVARGLVVRVGWRVYALPTNTAGMVDRAREDARRMLAEPGHGRPPAGFTVQELADRCDVAPTTVHNWLRSLRAEGVPVVATHPPRAGHHGPGYSRYRIEGTGRAQGTAPARLHPRADPVGHGAHAMAAGG